jgi:hypothetical protein
MCASDDIPRYKCHMRTAYTPLSISPYSLVRVLHSPFHKKQTFHRFTTQLKTHITHHKISHNASHSLHARKHNINVHILPFNPHSCFQPNHHAKRIIYTDSHMYSVSISTPASPLPQKKRSVQQLQKRKQRQRPKPHTSQC